MTGEEIAAMAESMGIPSSYYQFTSETAQPPPFLCYYLTDSDNFIADGVVYARIETLVMELYTAEKDFELEARVEAALTANDLAWQREEDYIGSERLWMITYTTEVCINE